jgi:phenylacetate-CoA ligase
LKVAEIYDHSGRKRPRPRVIFSTAEMLNDVQREYISSVFNCPVVQEYGCSEVDIIAFECPNGRYHLNTNRLYVEFPMLDCGNREVVITDLDNRCMPLLRYRLGDFAELINIPCPCGRPAAVLRRVVGRSVARVVPLPDGSFFHSVKFAHLTEHLCEQGFPIRQFRVDHLSSRKIIFRLSGEFSDFQKKNISDFLMFELNKLVKETMDIEILYCDIELDGKHAYYVNHFIDQ